MLSVYALCLCAQLSLGAGALLCLLFRCWLCSVRAERLYFPMACLAAGVQTPGKSHMSHSIPCEATQKHRKILQVPQIPQSCNVMHLQTTSRAADWDRKHTKTQNELQPQPPVHYISAAQQVRTSERLFELQTWHEALASRR